MSSLNPEQQEVVDDMIRCGFMSIGQAMYECTQGVNALVCDLEQGKRS